MFKQKLSYATIFNQRAKSYHLAMMKWPHARDQEFQALLQFAEIEPENIIADMPSGGGYLSKYTNNLLIHLETSHVFATCSENQTPHPVIITSDQSVPLKNYSIDAFLSLAGLHHLNDKAQLFNEMYRALKMGGKLVLADAEKNSHVAQFLDEFVHNHSSMGHVGSYLNKDTQIQLKNAGFYILKDEIIHYNWVFKSVDDMAEYAKLMFGIDKANTQKIIDGMRHHLTITEEKNSVLLGWSLRFIHACK